jgi:hypothetical protein
LIGRTRQAAVFENFNRSSIHALQITLKTKLLRIKATLQGTVGVAWIELQKADAPESQQS